PGRARPPGPRAGALRGRLVRDPRRPGPVGPDRPPRAARGPARGTGAVGPASGPKLSGGASAPDPRLAGLPRCRPRRTPHAATRDQGAGVRLGRRGIAPDLS